MSKHTPEKKPKKEKSISVILKMSIVRAVKHLKGLRTTSLYIREAVIAQVRRDKARIKAEKEEK